MPQRTPPKSYQLLVKTHKLTVFLTVHQSLTVQQLKEEVLSALTSSVLKSSSGVLCIPTAPGDDDEMMDEEERGNSEVPNVNSLEGFELCRAAKDKSKSSATSSAPTCYETLNTSSPIKGLLSNWETLYIQIRDESGDLLAVEVSQPSLLDDEEDEARRAPQTPESPMAVGKGKRKAPPE